MLPGFDIMTSCQSVSIHSLRLAGGTGFQAEFHAQGPGRHLQGSLFTFTRRQVVILSFDSYNSPLTCTLVGYLRSCAPSLPGRNLKLPAMPSPTRRSLCNETQQSNGKNKRPQEKSFRLSPAYNCLPGQPKLLTQQHPTAGFNSLLLPFIHLQPPVYDTS